MNKYNGNSMKTVAVLWLLVLGMCFGGQFFYGKIRITVSNKDVINVISYDYTYDNDNKIIYELPKSWRATENKDLKSKDVMYFVDFDGQEEKIYGDIQIGENNSSLQDMLHKRMEELKKKSNISKCESHITSDKKDDISKICYKLENVHGIITEHEEYFIGISPNYIRVSFSKLDGKFTSDDCRYISDVVGNIRKK